MKLAIIGSRTFNDYELMQTFTDLTDVTLIISGGAIGADSLAERLANENNIPTLIFKPDWKLNGAKAGFMRNTSIVENCDQLIAFWDGKSNGTMDSVKKARALGKPVTVIEPGHSNLDFT
jgi:YspA, cpYpsA-related SLOG family